MRRLIVVVLVVCASGVFVYTLAHAAIYTSNDDTDLGAGPVSSTTAIITSPSAQAGTPSRLRIPKIGVDAQVQHVGLGKTGNMAVPSNFTDVAWYREGTLPGDTGSAVIDGHIDNGIGLNAVFFRLGELSAGDDIYIDTADGNTLHFVVEDTETYPVDEVPREQLFNRADVPRLNLVTCEGSWITEQKMYDERHIVYAVLES